MKHFRILLLFLFLFVSRFSFAQYSESPSKPKIPLKDRIFVGGNFGFTFGSVTSVEISPQIGYKLTPNWSAGVGFRYSYYQDNYYTPPYKTSIYGGLVFSRYIIFKGLFLEGDFEANNYDVYRIVDPILGTYQLERMWVPSLLLGGGYAAPIGSNSAFFISILYDVLQNQYSPYYGVPVIRAGFGFGL